MTEAEARAYNRAIDDMVDLVTAATTAVQTDGLTDEARAVAKAMTAFVEAAGHLHRKLGPFPSKAALLDPTLEAP